MYGVGAQELLVFFVLVMPYFLATFGLVPAVARSKGRSGIEWFFVAVLVTPLLALIALAGMPEKRRDDDLPVAPEVPEFKWRKG